MLPNERGHYAIAPMEVELGVWPGTCQNQTQKWLRWWDNQGNLLLIGQEEAEKERAEKEKRTTKTRAVGGEIAIAFSRPTGSPRD